MSCFVHSEEMFNSLGKYFKEYIKMDSEFTDHLIFNLYQFEIISVNTRYNENNPADIQMYKGQTYEELPMLSSYDALKFLDSIKYQAADMKSEILWQSVINVHKKLVDGIVKVADLTENYTNAEEYEMSEWW
ncbi:hypothetical protein AYP1020_p45 (plasmid) [Staphylococcus capitis subsp. capitis]|uniref:hypothetical protein n=1 Tax=Staphylococcus capitis TaxID=29388 RepID=UPI0006557A71|nr:hypothetical protein [Staphylococcus capitis]AKL93500.1 hypothetical protein AYP1020_p45 [Staphylococcus capitis subsp. capitis]